LRQKGVPVEAERGKEVLDVHPSLLGDESGASKALAALDASGRVALEVLASVDEVKTPTVAPFATRVALVLLEAADEAKKLPVEVVPDAFSSS